MRLNRHPNSAGLQVVALSDLAKNGVGPVYYYFYGPPQIKIRGMHKSDNCHDASNISLNSAEESGHSGMGPVPFRREYRSIVAMISFRQI